MKTIKEWKKIARLLKEVYKELQAEAIKEGVNLMSPEYEELMNKARLATLEKSGWTLDEYRKIKEQIEGIDKVETVEVISRFEEKLDEIESRYIPNKEEIEEIAEEIAEEVAERIAKKYIVPPVIKNEIIKEYTVEKPKIVETVRVIKEKYDDTDLRGNIKYLLNKINSIQLPREVDEKQIKLDLFNALKKDINRDIEMLGMPDFRKLAMGLQQQIDERIIGVNTHKLTVSATEPTSPSVGDLWVQIS
jgi:nucleotidyltransferase/DNA polymerase involved in DNA repair